MSISSTIALNFVKRYWKQLAVLITFLSMSGYIYVINQQLENRNLKIEILEKEVNHYQLEIFKCKGRLEKLSEDIENYSEESKKKQEEIDSLQDKIDEILDDTSNGIDDLENEDAPDDCEATAIYLLEGLK